MASYIKNKLVKHLAMFCKNLTPDSINISLLKGEGEVSNVELDGDYLHSILRMPSFLRLQKATANHCSLKVSWTKLKTEPIKINIDKIDVVLEASEGIAKSDLYADAGTSAGPGAAPGAGPGAASKSIELGKYGFIHKIVDGMYLHVGHVHVAFAAPNHHSTMHLSGIFLQSTDGEWKVVELPKTRQRDATAVLTFKQLIIQSLTINVREHAHPPHAKDPKSKAAHHPPPARPPPPSSLSSSSSSSGTAQASRHPPAKSGAGPNLSHAHPTASASHAAESGANFFTMTLSPINVSITMKKLLADCSFVYGKLQLLLDNIVLELSKNQLRIGYEFFHSMALLAEKEKQFKPKEVEKPKNKVVYNPVSMDPQQAQALQQQLQLQQQQQQQQQSKSRSFFNSNASDKDSDEAGSEFEVVGESAISTAHDIGESSVHAAVSRIMIRVANKPNSRALAMIQFDDIRVHHYPVRMYQFDRSAWIEEMHGKQYLALLGLTESFTQIRCANLLVIPTTGAEDSHADYVHILTSLRTQLNLPPDTPIFSCDMISYYIKPADDKKEAQLYKQQLQQQLQIQRGQLLMPPSNLLCKVNPMQLVFDRRQWINIFDFIESITHMTAHLEPLPKRDTETDERVVVRIELLFPKMLLPPFAGHRGPTAIASQVLSVSAAKITVTNVNDMTAAVAAAAIAVSHQQAAGTADTASLTGPFDGRSRSNSGHSLSHVPLPPPTPSSLLSSSTPTSAAGEALMPSMPPNPATLSRKNSISSIASNDVLNESTSSIGSAGLGFTGAGSGASRTQPPHAQLGFYSGSTSSLSSERRAASSPSSSSLLNGLAGTPSTLVDTLRSYIPDYLWAFFKSRLFSDASEFPNVNLAFPPDHKPLADQTNYAHFPFQRPDFLPLFPEFDHGSAVPATKESWFISVEQLWADILSSPESKPQSFVEPVDIAVYVHEPLPTALLKVLKSGETPTDAPAGDDLASFASTARPSSSLSVQSQECSMGEDPNNSGGSVAVTTVFVRCLGTVKLHLTRLRYQYLAHIGPERLDLLSQPAGALPNSPDEAPDTATANAAAASLKPHLVPGPPVQGLPRSVRANLTCIQIPSLVLTVEDDGSADSAGQKQASQAPSTALDSFFSEESEPSETSFPVIAVIQARGLNMFMQETGREHAQIIKGTVHRVSLAEPSEPHFAATLSSMSFSENLSRSDSVSDFDSAGGNGVASAGSLLPDVGFRILYPSAATLQATSSSSGPIPKPADGLASQFIQAQVKGLDLNTQVPLLTRLGRVFEDYEAAAPAPMRIEVTDSKLCLDLSAAAPSQPSTLLASAGDCVEDANAASDGSAAPLLESEETVSDMLVSGGSAAGRSSPSPVVSSGPGREQPPAAQTHQKIVIRSVVVEMDSQGSISLNDFAYGGVGVGGGGTATAGSARGGGGGGGGGLSAQSGADDAEAPAPLSLLSTSAATAPSSTLTTQLRRELKRAAAERNYAERERAKATKEKAVLARELEDARLQISMLVRAKETLATDNKQLQALVQTLNHQHQLHQQHAAGGRSGAPSSAAAGASTIDISTWRRMYQNSEAERKRLELEMERQKQLHSQRMADAEEERQMGMQAKRELQNAIQQILREKDAEIEELRARLQATGR